ncbi:MAG: hypothetical protein IPL65_14970 [Lewinellaceae bacterium]|nr:hypothetical protein [Lewinellaceae bacterium]
MRLYLLLLALLAFGSASLSAQNFYEVKFPDDQVVYGCGATTDTIWPIVNQYTCNFNVGISVYDQVFYTNGTQGCYKIDRRFRLINWCNYNPAWSPWFVLNPPGSDIGPTVMGDLSNNGFLEYHQIIKVLDNEPPVFTDCPTDTLLFCDYSTNDPAQYNSNFIDYCEGVVSLTMSATDICSGTDINYRYLMFLDKNDDGVMETFISSSDPGAWPITLSNSGNIVTAQVQFQLGEGLPYGLHKIKWIAQDGCSNYAECIVPFEVRDCNPPTVVCLHGLSVNLMQGGMISIDDTALLEYTYDNCTPANQLVIGLVKASESTGDFPTGMHTVSFDCNELGTQEVQLWSMDAHGNADYCSTYVLVQDNMGICQPAGTLKGKVYTQAFQPVSGVQLMLKNSTGNISPLAETDLEGDFQITGQYAACQYQLSPWLDVAAQNGVNTLDALLIAASVSENMPLASAYSRLAADVDQSGAVNNADWEQTIQTAIGILPNFPQAPSWTFVTTAYNFPNPAQPWPAPQASEFCLDAGLDFNADFIAIKTGDVNGSANTDNLDRKSLPAVWFTAPNLRFEAGKTLRIPIRTPDLSGLPAWQFTLGYDPAMLQLKTIEPGLASIDRIGNFEATQRISAAWMEPAIYAGSISGKNFRGDAFTLVMEAQQTGTVSEALFLPTKKPFRKPTVRNWRHCRQALLLRPSKKASASKKFNPTRHPST